METTTKRVKFASTNELKVYDPEINLIGERVVPIPVSQVILCRPLLFAQNQEVEFSHLPRHDTIHMATAFRHHHDLIIDALFTDAETNENVVAILQNGKILALDQPFKLLDLYRDIQSRTQSKKLHSSSHTHIVQVHNQNMEELFSFPTHLTTVPIVTPYDTKTQALLSSAISNLQKKKDKASIISGDKVYSELRKQNLDYFHRIHPHLSMTLEHQLHAIAYANGTIFPIVTVHQQ
jgi:hypothetical protein